MRPNRFRVATTALAILAAATTASGPAAGQVPAPETWTPPRTADGRPDLQGTWSRKYATPFERPAQVAARQFFTEEEAAELNRRFLEGRSTLDNRYSLRGDTPGGDLDGENDGLSGLFDRGDSDTPRTLDPTRRTSLIVDPLNGRMPALTAEAQRRNDAWWQTWRRPPAGPEDRDSEERCLGTGPPVTGRVRIVQAPGALGYVVIVYERYNDRRIIPLDGRPHLPASIRLRNGDARGRWEGDTLVVDTTNFTDRDPMPNSGSEGFSAGLHLVERFTRTGPDTLLYEVTVEDPAYVTPYTAQIPLGAAGPMFEYACHEGNYGLANILAGARAAERSGGTIAGRTHDGAGQPLSNVDVEAYARVYSQYGHMMFGQVAAAKTDDHGEYRLFPVPPGEYYVVARQPASPSPGGASRAGMVTTWYPSGSTFAEATLLAIRSGEARTGVDIGLRTAVLFTVSGRVTGQMGTPVTRDPGLATASVVALSRAADASRFVGSVDVSTGRFDIPNLRPGIYDVYARVNDPANWLSGGSVGRIAVEVGDRDVEGLAVAVHSPVEVKGTITFDRPTAIDGTVGVTLRPDGSAAKVPEYQDVARRPAAAGSNGSFAIPYVPPGRFRVEPQGMPPGFYVSDVRQAGLSVYDSGLDVGAVPPSPIEVLVRAGAGTVRGVVRGGVGQPVSSATVVLIPEPPRRQNGALYAEAITDSMGAFTINGVAPGEYTLFAWEESVWSGAYQNPGFMAQHAGRGRSVMVAESATVMAEVTAIPARQ